MNPIEDSCCTVICGSNLATGFLVNIPTVENSQKYVLTCAHVLQSKNITTFYTLFKQNNIDGTITNIKAQFRIIGYDKFIDVMIGIFDESLPYNTTNNVDISQIHETTVNLNNSVFVEDIVYFAGTYDLTSPINYVQGIVSNPTYTQNFGKTVFENGLFPECMLINAHTRQGMSGGPVWKINELGNQLLVGMAIGTLFNEMAVVVKMSSIGWFLSIITSSLINYKHSIQQLQFSNLSQGKPWLGIISQYYHPILETTFPNLTIFPYVGGIYVSNVVIGYNTRKHQFVTNKTDVNLNTIILSNPLEKSNMYAYALKGIGIVLTSINGINLGKFPGQRPYSDFTYGFKPTGTQSIPSNFSGKYINSTVNTYDSVVLNYFYFDGQTWIKASETIGSNDASWYTECQVGSYFYVQHLFECPLSLINFLEEELRGDDDIRSHNNSYMNTGFWKKITRAVKRTANNAGSAITDFGNSFVIHPAPVWSTNADANAGNNSYNITFKCGNFFCQKINNQSNTGSPPLSPVRCKYCNVLNKFWYNGGNAKEYNDKADNG
jgi:hypothetical protein